MDGLLGGSSGVSGVPVADADEASYSAVGGAEVALADDYLASESA